MINNYLGAPGIEPGPMPDRQGTVRLLGYKGDQTPEDAPLEFASWVEGIRIERGSIRKDNGWTQIGSTAAGRVLALIEHKTIMGYTVTSFLVRIYRSAGGKGVIQALQAGVWNTVATTVEDVADVYLSAISIQNVLLFADGIRMWQLTLTPVLFNRGQEGFWDDGMTALEHRLIGDGIPDIVLDPDFNVAIVNADAYDDTYIANYEIEMKGSLKYNAYIAIKVDGIQAVVDIVPHDGAGDTTAVTKHTFREVSVYQSIAPNQVVSLELIGVAFDGPGSNIVRDGLADLWTDTGSGIDYLRIIKTADSQPAGRSYTYRYLVDATYPHTVDLYYKTPTGDITQVGSVIHNADAQGWDEVVVFPEDVPVGTYFLITNPTDITPMTGGHAAYFDEVFYDEQADIAVRSWEDRNGVVWYAQTGSTYEVSVVSPYAPGADWLLSLGDRVIALGARDDPQSVAWSADGIVDDWEGEDSGQISLLDTRSDAIDPVRAAGTVGQGIAALFRSRSIMRMVETGAFNQAVGVVHWIDYLGTESPFSVQSTRAGAIFLGHDKMVYLLRQDGPIAIGWPVKEHFRENMVDADLHLVDSAYDLLRDEYVIAVPEDGTGALTGLWAFQVGHFLNTQEMIWTRRSVDIERMGMMSAAGSSRSLIVFATPLHDVMQMDPAIITEDGLQAVAYWESQRLNRKNVFAPHTLTRVRLTYRSNQAVNVTVRASGDGSLTWGESNDFALVDTGKKAGYVDRGFYLSGSDIRIRIELPVTVGAGVYVTGFFAELVERADRAV